MSEPPEPRGQDELRQRRVMEEDTNDQDEADGGSAAVADPKHRQERGNRGPDDQPGFGQGA